MKFKGEHRMRNETVEGLARAQKGEVIAFAFVSLLRLKQTFRLF